MENTQLSFKDRVKAIVMYATIFQALMALWTQCRAYAHSFAVNRYGKADTSTIIELFIAVFLFAILMPIAFGQIFNTNTTGWDATTVLVYLLVPVIVIVVVLIAFIYYVKEH